MNKIISGKVYDTRTAKEVSDIYFGDLSETLYHMPNGDYFIYRESQDDTVMESDKEICQIEEGFGIVWEIIPVGDKEAKEWGERYLCGDEYDELFGAA